MSTQEAGGVYYTPREITSHIVRSAFEQAFASLSDSCTVPPDPMIKSKRGKKASFYLDFADKLREFKVMDPACGSGAELEDLVRQAYQVRETLYQELVAETPRSSVDWALRS